MKKTYKFYILLLIFGVICIAPLFCSSDYCPPDWVLGTWRSGFDDFVLEINENNIIETINEKSFDLNSMFKSLDNSVQFSTIARKLILKESTLI